MATTMIPSGNKFPEAASQNTHGRFGPENGQVRPNQEKLPKTKSAPLQPI
jgi:hypothetical protein